ncbi:unnamed protein product [Adineta steineri]|uniref:Uncharacterized protein n=1 Tax=Adineta steineri TaxID=433720 RepID=A0A815UA29_9BILA|nr:unnamed protein product [Adineta steineri]CAF3923862.1 unnamed protein product [Adineta steineri]
MDEQDWYEKNLDEFDDLYLSKDDSRLQQQQFISSKQKSLSILENNYYGNNYPIDLWYLIAMYIRPEDVGRFALICSATNQVVNSIVFWISLFRKYNKIQAKRTSRLLVREHVSIIRTYVIKSLYQSYPLFQERLNKTDAIQKEPHFLLSSRCVRIWYSKRTTPRELHNYYFEFCFDNDQQIKQENIQIEALSPMFQIDNQYMIDKNSYILHVICSNFVLMGPYMGLILSKIILNVSSDYRYHKLKMWFDSSKLSVQKSKYNDSVVIIDPVLCLRVYKWYNCPANLD